MNSPDTLRAVRRLLIILFILALPLQFTWGATARYCTHEKGDSVSHVGHHSHVHQAAVSDTDTAALFAVGDDPDCGYCHLGCAQPLASSTPNITMPSASVYIPPEPVPNSYRAPDWIERPNWSLAI